MRILGRIIKMHEGVADMDERSAASSTNGPREEAQITVESFSSLLAERGLQLLRGETAVLQVNMGLICNQACRHCHLEAGPDRNEMMNLETCNAVVAFAGRNRFRVIDFTGGAPELNPNLTMILEKCAELAPRLILRSNLTAIKDRENNDLIDICSTHRIAIVASFPSLHKGQLEAQRGSGIFEKSISTLRLLNKFGYGREGSGLELNLVASPTGAFLPSSQIHVERRFRAELQKKWGITFNHLYTFANAPLGKFRHWLELTGNFESYMGKLASSFNPCTIEGLMCRTLLSVSWDGYLFDCDFNLARGLFMGGKKVHISEADSPPPAGSPVAVADHCYACTAGSGFT